MRPLLQPVAPSIDDPIELLQACHDKVRRFAGLTLRLRAHLAERGADDQAQEAARSILRYFDMAAPLHHDDEDLDLFPALRALGQAELTARIDELEAQHVSLSRLWQALHPWLSATAAGQSCAAPAEVDEFATAYPAHAAREETEIYPAAAQLSVVQLRHISDAMVRRRTPA
jgi:hemerythrin-like domain-containing protein